MPSIFENGAAIYFPDTKKFKINPVINKEKSLVFQEVKKTLIKITTELGGIQELGKDFSFSSSIPVGMNIPEYFEIFRKKLLQQTRVGEVIEVMHFQFAVDVTIKGVNKRTVLGFWCQETSANFEELVAISDNRGDPSVLEVAKIPMCPNNATKNVKGTGE